MKVLAIITTHPIQYNAPLFRILTERQIIKPVVYYTWGKSVLASKFDPGFGKEIKWDIPLLGGYEYYFPENTSKDPGSHHHNGIDNPGLIKSLEALDPDAILVYGWNFKSHLAVMKHFKGRVPLLFRGDSTLMKETGIRRFLKKLYLSAIYRHADYFLFAGTRNREYYEASRIRKAQLFFMPHAVDNARFGSPGAGEVAKKLRMELGLHQGAMVYLYAGKIDPNKNVELLIRAFLQVDDLKTFLVIAGEGPSRKEIFEKYNRHPRIKFLPFQNQAEMPGVYRLGDVFVLPSLSETWGLAINESFACGRPVICSDACGAAIDLCKNGKTGFIFRSNDLGDLAAKMKALNDKDLALKMGEQAAQLVSAWNFETAAKTIEDATIHATS